MSRGKGDVAVGDHLMVTVETSRPDADLYDDRECVTEVVTVDRVTVMHCGCSRAEFPRPFSEGGPCPRVAVFSPGCRWTTDYVDFDEARREAGQLSAPKAAPESQPDSFTEDPVPRVVTVPVQGVLL